MSIIPTLSSEALKDIIQTMAKFKREGPKSRKRGTAVSQLSLLYDVTKSHIYAIVKKAQNEPQAAITEAPVNGMMVDAFTENTMSGISIEASTSDDLANLFLLQVKLVGWARENTDEANQLQELGWKVSHTIEALEQARYISQIEFDKSDMQANLDAAARELQSLRDIIDREREERRRKDAKETHGE